MDAATPLRADEDDAANCNTAAANTAMTSNSHSVLEFFAVLWADDGLLAAWAGGQRKGKKWMIEMEFIIIIMIIVGWIFKLQSNPRIILGDE